MEGKEYEVTEEDYWTALEEIEPTPVRGGLLEMPEKTWDDIGGLEEEKEKLKRYVELPLRMPERLEEFGIDSAKGILLYGPPGTGKTLLARAVANESEANYISVEGPELLNKYVGESEKNVREVFEKAREASPSIICFDEIDALSRARGTQHSSAAYENVVSQLQTEMDGLKARGKITVIGATNRPKLVDPALLRPGRLGEEIEVDVPTLDAKVEIFKIHGGERPLAPDVNFERYAQGLEKMDEDYTGADIEKICEDAAYLAIEDSMDKIADAHFQKAIEDLTSETEGGGARNLREMQRREEEAGDSASYVG